ncbi:alpha/beta fold hydrolase [Blastococcus saxobsidens]|uniref:Alpha/beta fold hydrolase n=1 Tax=Blastococcus saxobsidens TaxID=138336 RepID=A0A6L9VXU5_9ACTN|nr:alpha/beta fold hydrolase [Blastococcus saxobsidens]
MLVLLAVAVLGAAALAVVLLTREHGPAASVRLPAAGEEPGPVLLVPGYGGNTAVLEPLADRLRAAGRDVTVIAVPGDGTGDLRESAAVLDAGARAALERTGAESVDVVGYSAGGLVARIWVADGNADVARRVVTLGAPHHGTELAGFAGAFAADRCPDGCRQMVPGSDLLVGLNEDETPDGVDWVSLWTEQDSVVTPPGSARLDGALNLPVQSICAGARLTHQGLPTAPVVTAIVVEQLTADEVVPLAAADCARLGG